MGDQRTRRGFLRDLARLGGGVASLGLLASCAGPSPRAPARVYRVGLLGTAGAGRTAFWERLAELGYVEGQNLVREERVSDPAQINDAAAELVRLAVDVIVAVSLPYVRAAMNETASIPIVILGGGNPVAAGLVDSLARPGRNVTGIASQANAGDEFDLNLKRIELLKEAAPGISRVAVFTATSGSESLARPEARSVARSLGVDLLVVSVDASMSRADFEAAFERGSVEGADAALISGGGVVSANAPLIASLVERYRWSAVSVTPDLVRRGLLMAYVPRAGETQRRAADYVDRILRGARPADLPIELTRGYDLIVNMGTARALGLTLSQDFLDQATEVIE